MRRDTALARGNSQLLLLIKTRDSPDGLSALRFISLPDAPPGRPRRQLRAQRQRRDQIIAMILAAEWNGLGLPQRVQPLGQGGSLIGELPGIGFIRAVEHQRRKHLKAGIEQHTA